MGRNMMDSETLTFLLRGGHLTMSERIEKGIWPHPPLKYNDVLRHLTRLIEAENWFPHEWKPAVPGEPVNEHAVIENRSRFSYVYHSQRHHPTNPTLLAEQVAKTFFFSKKIARFYLKWELHLPGDLDGWKVIR
jgi:hypothetical protein